MLGRKRILLVNWEEVACRHWFWHTVGDSFFYDNEEQVKVKGILTILGSEREGVASLIFNVMMIRGSLNTS